MLRSLNIAATGLQARQTEIDAISNNLSNINTTGYNRQRADFQDLLYQNFSIAGANSSDSGTIIPTGIQMGLGVKTAAISRNTGQGALQSTSNTFDLAVQGKGYFQIALPDGSIAYTRDGTFSLSESGELVTADGYLLQPAITIPQNAIDVSINQAGEVSVTTQGTTAPQLIGQIQTVSFINKGGLQAIGNNLFLETSASGSALTGTPGTDGFGTILQGFLERSNVDPATELTGLIVAQRAYEMVTKIISKADEMLQSLNQNA